MFLQATWLRFQLHIQNRRPDQRREARMQEITATELDDQMGDLIRGRLVGSAEGRWQCCRLQASSCSCWVDGQSNSFFFFFFKRLHLVAFLANACCLLCTADL